MSTAAYATKRTPGRLSHGARVAAIARSMGKPLMPWQQQVVDVATEELPDGSPAYGVVVISVPRQAGKSTLVAPWSFERCIDIEGGLTWYTAQSRLAARDNFTEVLRLLKRSPLGSRCSARLSNGSESVEFANGSAWRLFSPTPDALHGRTNELVVVDEAWAFTGSRGIELEQGIIPGFTTTNGQLVLLSTAGTPDSAWLLSYVERGRAAVRAERNDNVAYFEWAVPADRVDDLATALAAGVEDRTAPVYLAALQEIFDAHPAKGHTLKQRALNSAAETMAPGEFLRAYGNCWTAVAERVVPADAVADCETRTWPKPTRPVALGFDVAIDRRSAAIVAAWRDRPDGLLRFDVIVERTGTSWVAAELLRLQREVSPAAIAHPGAGPGADIADEAARLGVTFTPAAGLATRDYVAACASFLAALVDRRASHLGQAPFLAACSAAAKRTVGDAWCWSRRESAVSIAPLTAATCAAWAFDHQVHVPAPVIRSRVSATRGAR